MKEAILSLDKKYSGSHPEKNKPQNIHTDNVIQKRIC
jgi:hypothetical protein